MDLMLEAPRQVLESWGLNVGAEETIGTGSFGVVFVLVPC